MGSPFSVNPESLAEAVQRMSDFQSYAEEMLNEIERIVANMHATWTGEAAAAHVQAHQHWTRGEAMMREALGQLRSAGQGARDNYRGAMTTNQAMWT